MLRSCLKRYRVMSVLPEVMYPHWFRQVTLQSSFVIRMEQSLKFLADTVHHSSKGGQDGGCKSRQQKTKHFFFLKNTREATESPLSYLHLFDFFLLEAFYAVKPSV